MTTKAVTHPRHLDNYINFIHINIKNKQFASPSGIKFLLFHSAEDVKLVAMIKQKPLQFKVIKFICSALLYDSF